MTTKRGRRRVAVCLAGLHGMTDANRRWKCYTLADGSTVLLSNGCRACNAEGSRRYRNAHATESKLRRLGAAT